jgi:hypothetical protein
MQNPSDISVKNEIENFPRPKIVVTDEEILISDPPLPRRLFLTLFSFAVLIFALKYNTGRDRLEGSAAGIFLSLLFIYDSLSLQRVRIDLKNKCVFRRSINPMENLVNYLLKRPFTIPFSDIDKIYSDFTPAFGGQAQRYYMYLRSKDQHNLQIGTFNKEAQASTCAVFLNKMVHSK